MPSDAPTRLLMLAPLLIAATACGGPDTDESAAPAGGEAPATGASEVDPLGGPDAFVDGPDLWVADLAYSAAGVPVLGEGRNVTARAGYDNQPRFLPDGTILYTRGVGDRTDIWRYDAATDSHRAVTETPDQSEYSPTPTPDGGFSAIVVEPDSLQRLWRFDLDGSNGRPLFPDIAPVGYHAWLDDERIGMFVLGDPATLQSGAAGSAGAGTLHDEGIGRSLNVIPGRTAISYPVGEGDAYELRALVQDEGGLGTAALVRIAAQDHAWAPGDWILFGRGHRLLAVGPLEIPAGSNDRGALFDEPAIGVGALPDTTLSISRLAISDDGASIVLVVDRPAN